MRRILLPRRHKEPATAGRHMRAMPTTVMASAALTLMGAPALDPLVTGATGGPDTVAPDTLAAPELRPEPEAAPVPLPASAAAPVAAAVPAPVPQADAAVEAVGEQGHGVTLGFSDGASVALEDDDPRLRTFRATVDAMLSAPEV